MGDDQLTNNLFAQLQRMEADLAVLEKDPAAAGNGAHAALLAELRALLGRVRDESTASSCESVLRDKQLSDLKKEAESSKTYISALQERLSAGEPPRAPAAPPPATEAAPQPAHPGGVRADLPLTAQEDRAHNQLEGERQEFKQHYDALETDFEATEKKLMEEIRELKDNEAKTELEFERLKTELLLAREKRQAAESKATSLSVELMELNVYNKSAAAALKDKDREIADLKQALEEAKRGRP